MPDPQRPPKLDYSTQPKSPKPKPSELRKLVELMRFCIFGAIALPFYFFLMVAAEAAISSGPLPPIRWVAFLGIIAVVSTWCAVKSLREFLR